jgi:hypothetical protein
LLYSFGWSSVTGTADCWAIGRKSVRLREPGDPIRGGIVPRSRTSVKVKKPGIFGNLLAFFGTFRLSVFPRSPGQRICRRRKKTSAAPAARNKASVGTRKKSAWREAGDRHGTAEKN